MFFFHGWAVIQHTFLGVDLPDADERQRNVIERVRARIATLDRLNVSYELKVQNGCANLLASGCVNHGADSRAREVFDLWRFIAETAPGSFGLLYYRDDECEPDVHRVQVLRRGTVEERNDPFLSPIVPTVEDQYEG